MHALPVASVIGSVSFLKAARFLFARMRTAAVAVVCICIFQAIAVANQSAPTTDQMYASPRVTVLVPAASLHGASQDQSFSQQ
jgi:multidrug resistance efflux pump